MSIVISARARASVYCAISTLLLFLGFYAYHWHVADQHWSLGLNSDMESHVAGRLVKSRQDGVLSDGGLLGLGSATERPAQWTDGEKAFEFQRQAYLEGLSFQSFTTYNSHLGGQGIFFSMMDALIPLSPQATLEVFYGLNAMFTALALGLVVAWFYGEFGFLTSLFVLASALGSPWLIVFGGKLFWSLWSFYVPLVVVLYYLRSKSTMHQRHIRFALLVALAVLVKCLFTGFEYITTALIMPVVPLVYYGVKNGWEWRELLKGFLTMVFGASIAVLVSLGILTLQIASAEGSLAHAVSNITISLQKRTYGTPQEFPGYAESLAADLVSVVVTYFTGTFLDVGEFESAVSRFVPLLAFPIRYIYLVCLFGVSSVVLWALGRRRAEEGEPKGDLALVAATWFSILAPLSWFIIFKAHSYVHTHMNFVVWQMPFTLFGFAVCGLTLKRSLAPILGRRRPGRVS